MPALLTATAPDKRHAATLALACALTCAAAVDASAQNWPQQSWYNQSLARVNPAVSANAYTLSATGFLRRQWVNLPGAPATEGLTVATPVYRYNMGGALAIERDAVGAQTVTQARASLAFAPIAGDDFRLSVGGGVSFRASALDGAALRTDDGAYLGSVFDHRDRLLPSAEQSATSLGFDAGVAVAFGETEIGASVLDVNAPAAEFAALNTSFTRTLLVFATTTLPVNETLDLQLSGIFQDDTRVSQAQVSAFAWYNGNIGVGGAFRGYSANTVDAASLLLGWRASAALTFAYAYDLGLSSLSEAHDGSHEISVRFELSEPIGKGKLPPVIFNPRL